MVLRQYVHHRTLRSYRLNVVHCRSVIFLPCLLRTPNLPLPYSILSSSFVLSLLPRQTKYFCAGKRRPGGGEGRNNERFFLSFLLLLLLYSQFHISVFFAFVSMLPSVIFLSGGRIQTAVESPLCDHHGWLSRALIPCRKYFQSGGLYSTQVESSNLHLFVF